MSPALRCYNLYQSLAQSAQRCPDNLAFVIDHDEITYGQFFHHVQKVSGILQNKYGLSKNDKIILSLGNDYSFCTVLYAAMGLGIVVIPVSTKLTPTEVAPLLQQITPAWILCHDSYAEKFSSASLEDSQLTTLSEWEKVIESDVPPAVLPIVHSHDTAVIIFTSGTTGLPKGAIISHGNLMHGIDSYKTSFSLTEKDKTILAVPIYHITGLAAILGLFIHIGGTIHLHRKFNAEHLLNCIQQGKITFLHGSPTVFILLCSTLKEKNIPYNLDSIKKIACGGGHLNSGTVHEIQQYFKNSQIHPVYGLSETSSPASIFFEDASNHTKQGSSGKAIPGVEFRITTETGVQLPPGETGELWVKGPVVIQSYWNNPTANEASFDQGWFNTGDLAYIDSDDYLYIQGRSKDMINRGGEKVYSLEVESLLSTFPGVKEVALVPYPSKIYGEEPMAFIVTDPSYMITAKEIMAWSYERLAKYKVPKKIIFMDDLPRTSNGKISKLSLKKNIKNYL